MRRFLCFSLCLGLMVSACKKKSLEESVNKAIAKAGGGAGSGSGGGDDGGTTVKKHNKAAVLKACLPLINTKMIELWAAEGFWSFYLRRSTAYIATPADPLVVLYAYKGLPLYFAQETTTGLGKDAATVTANLNKMAASKVIQDQFVARDGNAPGWRVHLSAVNTNVELPKTEAGQPPVAPNDSIIIYDPEGLQAANKEIPLVSAVESFEDAKQADSWTRGNGWFDCVVDDKTQDVTLKYTRAKLTEA